jgi:hypothetical protein
MHLTIAHRTANSALMTIAKVREAVLGGIDNPSDAIIPFGQTLYRTAHARRYVAGRYDTNAPEAAYASCWWATSDDYLAATWFSQSPSLSTAARQAFAIHPAWRSDCASVTSVVPLVDLSVWYGLGKTITADDPATLRPLTMPASADILQIYIPGFEENFAKWARLGKTVPFGS